MSKMPIAWYKNNLNNMKYYLRTQEENLAELHNKCKDIKDKISHLTKQIEHAEQKGLTEFDATRLLKSQSKKNV